MSKFLKFRIYLILLIFSIFIGSFYFVKAASLGQQLSGRILLQVEASGEAWYVNPQDNQRYYLGRPDDAFKLMRTLGLGINEASYAKFKSQGSNAFRGRILLRVEAKGEAYYVNPLDAKLYYLGRPSDAFSLMRHFGLGISNANLNQIVVNNSALNKDDNPVKTDSSAINTRDYHWRYKNADYSLSYNLSESLYQKYRNSAKVYTYYPSNKPDDVREAFYAMFLQTDKQDQETISLLEALKQKASALGLSPDEEVAFIVSFIQYLDYDLDRAAALNNSPNYPFETLYLKKGICSDTSFLAVLWLRELGYGAAILDFPEANHAALGIACPLTDSIQASGYCYVETTNFFPFGVVPAINNDGQAQDISNNLKELFSASDLGKLEIRQATKGRIYQGVSVVKKEANFLAEQKREVDNSKIELDAQKEALDVLYAELSVQQNQLESDRAALDLNSYNQAVRVYNNSVQEYQDRVIAYQQNVDLYNQQIASFNTRYKAFYQQ